MEITSKMVTLENYIKILKRLMRYHERLEFTLDDIQENMGIICVGR